MATRVSVGSCRRLRLAPGGDQKSSSDPDPPVGQLRHEQAGGAPPGGRRRIRHPAAPVVGHESALRSQGSAHHQGRNLRPGVGRQSELQPAAPGGSGRSDERCVPAIGESAPGEAGDLGSDRGPAGARKVGSSAIARDPRPLRRPEFGNRGNPGDGPKRDRGCRGSGEYADSASWTNSGLVRPRLPGGMDGRRRPPEARSRDPVPGNSGSHPGLGLGNLESRRPG